eukprot:1992422-Rhodomonas_salina.1
MERPKPSQRLGYSIASASATRSDNSSRLCTCPLPHPRSAPLASSLRSEVLALSSRASSRCEAKQQEEAAKRPGIDRERKERAREDHVQVCALAPFLHRPALHRHACVHISLTAPAHATPAELRKMVQDRAGTEQDGPVEGFQGDVGPAAALDTAQADDHQEGDRKVVGFCQRLALLHHRVGDRPRNSQHRRAPPGLASQERLLLSAHRQAEFVADFLFGPWAFHPEVDVGDLRQDAELLADAPIDVQNQKRSLDAELRRQGEDR